MSEILESKIAAQFIAANARSRAHAERAEQAVPTGTSRSLLRHAPFPFYTAEASGIYAVDLDGNRRIDFNNNYTAQVLGHAHPRIVRAIRDQLPRGTSFSAPSAQELELAETIAGRVASIEQVVFGNSGTEAVMAALRAARAHTGRNKIAKFEGAYHGWSDFVAVGGHALPELADPRRMTQPTPDVGGLPAAATEDVILIRYNDPDAVSQALATHGEELAAVIVEPVLGAGGVIPAERSFLEALRERTRESGTLLICDEVITLRLAIGGGQALYELDPDLTTMGKIIGGGFPIGAVGGRRKFMRCFSEPARGGTIASMGTFNANPISVRAGLETLRELDAAAIHHINELGDLARDLLAEVIQKRGLPAQVTGVGSLFQLHFATRPILEARTAHTADAELALLCFLGLANRGIQLAMRGMGAISTPMRGEHIEALVCAFEATALEMREEGWFAARGLETG